MAVLRNRAQGSVDNKILSIVWPAIAKHAWEWYDENVDTVLFTRKVAKFIPITVRVRDLYPVMIILFGERA